MTADLLGLPWLAAELHLRSAANASQEMSPDPNGTTRRNRRRECALSSCHARKSDGVANNYGLASREDRQRRQIMPAAAKPHNAIADGSGTVPTLSVKLSASGPVPHVQTYVPGVAPRLDNDAPFQVSVSESAAPEL